MSAELDALQEQVTRVTAVNASAVALIHGLADQIEANKTDPVKLQALAAELRQDADDLGAAVAANTPATP
jgi:hypothetical protein